MGATCLFLMLQIGAATAIKFRGSQARSHNAIKFRGSQARSRNRYHLSIATNRTTDIQRYEKCWDAGVDMQARDAACEGDLICSRAGFDDRICGDCKDDHCCSKVQNLEKVDLNKIDAFCLRPVAWLAPTNVTEQAESFLELGAKLTAENAPFSEEGYMSVVKLSSDAMMTKYIRRLVDHMDLYIRDEGAMSGMVPHFSGMKTSQTFFALKQELLGTATIPHAWVLHKDDVYSNKYLDYVKSFAGSFLWDGRTAPLNSVGYHAIARLRSDKQMGEFVKRVVRGLDLYVSDEGRLNGFVQYFSGTKVVQTFALLRYQLIGAVRDIGDALVRSCWISSGDAVVLDEVGYQSVAGLLDDKQMAIFIRRVAAHHGCSVINEGGFMGVVPHFSGTADVQSLVLLEQEVRHSCGLTGSDPYYGKIHDVVGENGVLQIRLETSTRYNYSTDALQSAGIVPTYFSATDMHTAPTHQLDQACYPNKDDKTLLNCKRRELELGTKIGLGSQPGCRSKAEQAITDSHKQALEYAYSRNESEWTAIIEDDVVPLHPGLFSDSFELAWSRMPPEAKMVRLSWCSFEKDLGSIKKETFADAGNFRLVKWMSWDDAKGVSHYYTGGCTTGYIVHQSFLPELLGIFPCCCPIDCCMERQLFYAPPREHGNAKFRGEEILMNLDAWDSKEDSFNYTKFNQGGILVQDNRDIASTRPEWMTMEL